MCGSGDRELALRRHSKTGASPPHCCHDTVTATTAMPDVTQEICFLCPDPAAASLFFDPTHTSRLRVLLRLVALYILRAALRFAPSSLRVLVWRGASDLLA
eukprot:6213865-Pleurochrysis_carterae.AAC.2